MTTNQKFAVILTLHAAIVAATYACLFGAP